MSQIQVIELDRADPREMGKAYGRAAGDKIAKLLAVYTELFGSATGENWERIIARGRDMIPRAREFAPDLLEELEGIASGAQRCLEEIFLLNARSEILFSSVALGMEPPGECTSLLALPEATASGTVLLAQNWDWYTDMLDCQVILKIAGRDGIPPLITFTEAGQLAKLGLNGAGVGLAINNLICDQPRPGVPWIFISRKILESSHLAESLGWVLSTNRAHSMNYLIAHGAAEGVCLETAPEEEHVFWPRNGILCHTNHFLRSGRTFKDLKPRRDQYASTFVRHRRADVMLAGKAGRLDRSGIKEILCDHFDRPFSICLHTNPALEPLKRVSTCLSIIVDLKALSLEYCLGNPCRGEWIFIDASDFLAG